MLLGTAVAPPWLGCGSYEARSGGGLSFFLVGVQLPLEARVLLAGDHIVWDPRSGDDGRALWTHLPPAILPGCLARALSQGVDWEGVHGDCSGWADSAAWP